MRMIKAPRALPTSLCNVFLAGSIEMGRAENWQEKVAKELKDYDVTLLNPRRDDWDSSWEQKKDNPKFYEQVTWELNALENSDIIFMYFQPGTQSPISLLELGLYADKEMLIVCCPEGFWRKGNVDIVCEFYGIPLFDNLEEAIEALKEEL